MENLTIALRSIKKNKNRNLLTMLGIIIGIASVICILAVGDGFTQSITKELGQGNTSNKVTLDYQANSADSADSSGFTSGDAALLSDVKGVNDVKLSNYDSTVFTNVSSQGNKMKTYIGAIGKKSDVNRTQRSSLLIDDNSYNVLISNRLKQKLFGNDSANGKTIQIGTDVFVIRGTFSTDEYSTNVYMPKKTFNHIFAGKSGKNQAKLTVESGQSKKAVGQRALKKIKASGEYKHEGKYSIEDPTKAMKSFQKVLNSVTYFVALVAGISLLIAGIGVMNVMYISVSERRGEIVIRRAFGATGKNIRNQFLTESIVLCVIGGILGIIIGYLLVLLINAFLPFKAVITIYSILISLLVSCAVGLLFGFIPANKAAKSSLVGLLKEE